jgi:ketosteroid isomerase-like protein
MSAGRTQTTTGRSAGTSQLDVVRGYHRAWTGGDYEKAGTYLSPDLEVEVPLNDYETAAQFMQAVASFGELVDGVQLLAETTSAGEVMLLYDVSAAPIGNLRVAEHFTVRDGRIVRIRHIHDTAALRAAGFERS